MSSPRCCRFAVGAAGWAAANPAHRYATPMPRDEASEGAECPNAGRRDEIAPDVGVSRTGSVRCRGDGRYQRGRRSDRGPRDEWCVDLQRVTDCRWLSRPTGLAVTAPTPQPNRWGVFLCARTAAILADRTEVMRVMNADATESQIAAFLSRYTPAIEAQLREARGRLRALFPRGFELVYDNYNALVFAISPTERTSEAFLSVAGYPKWVTLFFLHGATLHDPNGLLEGEGKQVRGIRLKDPSNINTPEVEALIA